MNVVTPASTAVEAAARRAYGKLVALLAARSGDIAAAEDALADAFALALAHWPVRGLPRNPEGWLHTVARRRLWDAHRHRRVQAAGAEQLDVLAGSDGLEGAASPEAGDGPHIPDHRLALLFACAHPAIDRTVRPALMLQAVLGLPVARMAPAFLTAPATLGQRLVRAKSRIRDAGVPFEHPRGHELPKRLADVCEAIYAAYGVGWELQRLSGADGGGEASSLAAEAIELCRTLVLLSPREPEPAGLLALMLFCESRRQARRNASGAYVPLSGQDTACWDLGLLGEAEDLLQQTARLRAPGPYQLEAAIQSAHSQRRLGREVPPRAVLALYDGLVACSAHMGARIGRACALADVSGPVAGLAALDALDTARVAQHQPYWAARADLLRRSGDMAAAREAYGRAIGLASDSAVKEWLLARQREIPGRHSG